MKNLKNVLLIDGSVDCEIRTAIVDSANNLIDYNFYRSDDSILNNIYIARIEELKPSIEAIFVRYGNNESGFLSFNDVHPSYYLKRYPKSREDYYSSDLECDETPPRMVDVLKKGQFIIVQVVRCGIDKKLPTLTTYINLIGRNCIYLPNDENSNGISRKITGEERAKLKEFLSQLEHPGSLIVRTASEGVTIKEIRDDYKNLVQLWRSLQRRLMVNPRIGLIFQEDLLLKSLRSYSKHDVTSVLISNKNVYKKVKDYVAQQMLRLPSKIDYYPYDNLFNLIESEIENLYKNKLSLESGGSITIEPTEALVAIDINSKNSSRENNMEQTAFCTNKEAIEVIVKQIILRNLGGLIVIDCIDMEDDANISEINRLVKDAFKNDKAAVRIVGYSPLGLIQISRQRLDSSIVNRDFLKCSCCKGFGYVLRPEIKALHLVRKIMNVYESDCYWKVYISSDILEYIVNEFYDFVANYTNIEWQVVEEDDQMCDTIQCL